MDKQVDEVIGCYLETLHCEHLATRLLIATEADSMNRCDDVGSNEEIRDFRSQVERGVWRYVGRKRCVFYETSSSGCDWFLKILFFKH